MNQILRRSLPVFAVYSVSAALLQAHPGHDGHENGGFTWDFSHLTAHPFATLGCVALLSALVWVGVAQLRNRRSVEAQSLRKSTAK